MHTRVLVCALAFLYTLISFSTGTPSPNATPPDVIHTMTVANHLEVTRTNAPVSWSIPLGIDHAITDTSGLRVYRGNIEIDAQLTPLARWGGAPDNPASPIAWLLVDVILNLEPHESALLYLTSEGASPAAPSPLGILHDDSSITVETGAATYTLSKTAFRLFDTVTLADATAFPGGGGIALNSTITPYPATITVEHQGINRISLWVDGSVSPDLDFTARIHFYRNLAEVRIDFRLENPASPVEVDGQPGCNDYGSPGSVTFDDISLIFPSDKGQTFLYPDGETGTNTTITGSFTDHIVLFQESSGDGNWDALQGYGSRLQASVAKRPSTITLDGTAGDGPNQLDGWLDARQISVAVEKLWQNFPKALRADTSGLEIGLFPGEYGGNHELRAGEYKTHTLWVRHHGPSASDIARRARSFGSPLRLLPAVRDVVETEAAGLFAPRMDADFPDFETGTDYQIIPSPEWIDEYPAVTVLDAISLSQCLGWVDYGDIPTEFEILESPFNLKYDMVRGLILHAFRNDARPETELVWWDLASASARHAADIDILHSDKRGYDTDRMWYEGGMYGHGYHEEPATENPHRNYMNPAVSMSGPCAGMILWGLVSGDTLVMDSAMELADNMAWRTTRTSYWEYPDCAASSGIQHCADICEGWSGTDYGRTMGNMVKAMLFSYLATGDSYYLDVISSIAAYVRCVEQSGGGYGCNRFHFETTFVRNLGHYLHVRDRLGLPEDTTARALLQDRLTYMTDTLWDPATDEFRLCYDSPDLYPYHDNWLLAAADSFAMGSAILGQADLLADYGHTLFNDGSANQFYDGSALSYHSAKEFVNQVGFGHFFLYQWYREHMAAETHTVTVTIDGTGTVSPSGPVDVLHGDNRVFELTPDGSGAISDIRVDGVSTGSTAADFVLRNVTADATVTVVFSDAVTYTHTVYIPHIDWSTQWSSYLVIDNTGEQTFEGMLTLYESGEVVHTETVTVGAGRAGSVALMNGSCGIFQYDTGDVYLKKVFVNNVQYGIAEFPLSADTADTIHFLLPNYLADDLTWMGIAIMNPNNVVINATMRAIGPDGDLLDEVIGILGAQDRSVGMVNDFFPFVNFRDVARIEVIAEQPVCGLNISGYENARLLFTPAIDDTPDTGRLQIAHIAQEWSYWNNFLVFDNIGTGTASATLTLYNGGTAVQDVLVSIPAGSNTVVQLNDYLSDNPECGHVAVGTGKLAIRQSYQNTAGWGTAEFLLSSDTGNSLVYNFPSYSSDELDWFGLAVSNTGGTTDTVTLTAYRDGTALNSTQREVGGHSRMADLLSNLFPAFSGGDIDRVIVTGGNPLSGINISGAGQERYLFTPAFPGMVSGPQTVDTSPPSQTTRLIFVHHSTGENWLSDAGGQLGMALRDNNYFVSDTNYGWGPDNIGDNTDTGHWYNWFLGPSSGTFMNALFNESDQHCSYSRLGSAPGGENTVIMFKSCFPNSHISGDPTDPPLSEGASNPLYGQDAYSPHMTVENIKGLYRDLLDCFENHPDKLFVLIVPPPLVEGGTDAAHAANARAVADWLVNQWLDGYAGNNVAVFDFYNILTSNGGDTSTHDLGAEPGNHHRVWNGRIQHIHTLDSDYCAYASSPGDSHPTAAGGQKASGEFLPLLNAFYNRWHTP